MWYYGTGITSRGLRVNLPKAESREEAEEHAHSLGLNRVQVFALQTGNKIEAMREVNQRLREQSRRDGPGGMMHSDEPMETHNPSWMEKIMGGMSGKVEPKEYRD
jgi:hypothetical protein